MNNATTTATRAVRTAVYVRISDDKTGEGDGVERQESDCRELADRLGWTVSRVYCDNDISAYSGKKRPDYDAMLNDVKAGLIDAVIAWHPDRLHRAPKELERYIDVCERIPTHTVRAGLWDLSTATGKMIARQIGNAARYESDLKSERVKAARVQSATRGVWHGGLRPYGYSGGVPKDADGRPVVGVKPMQIVPHEAAEVVKMCEAIAAGQSLRSVVRDLNMRGVPTSTGQSRWQTKTVREMLMRPTIAGYSVHNGEIAGKGAWEPIVDETLWRTVVSVLSNPARSVARGDGRRGRDAVWLGSGVYRCGVCGGPMKVHRTSAGRRSYRCNRPEGDTRTHVTRGAEALDAYVEALVVDYWSKPGRVEKVLARDDSTDTAALRAELAAINTKKDELAVLYADDALDAGQFAVASARLADRAKAIAEKLAAVGVRSPLEPLAHGDIGELWAGLTLAQKRAILRVTADITVEPMGRRNRNQDISDGVTVKWSTSRSPRKV